MSIRGSGSGIRSATDDQTVMRNLRWDYADLSLERRYRRSKSEPDRAAYFEALRNKHAEFAAKKNRYWGERISDEEGCPANLWRSLARILRR